MGETPIIELVVDPTLPADDLMDAAEFILLVLSVHGNCLDFVSPQSAFANTTHPQIGRISKYLINNYEDMLSVPADDRKARAHELINKLKEYCDVTVLSEGDDDDDESYLKLMVLKSE